MTLWIYDSGASTAEIERGVAAAIDVFERHALTPEHCAAQVLALSNDDAYDERGVAAWNEADDAAMTACCAGWNRTPPAGHLEPE